MIETGNASELVIDTKQEYELLKIRQFKNQIINIAGDAQYHLLYRKWKSNEEKSVSKGEKDKSKREKCMGNVEKCKSNEENLMSKVEKWKSNVERYKSKVEKWKSNGEKRMSNVEKCMGNVEKWKSNVERYKSNEENRLRAICDNGYVSSYFYDAGGERTVKLHGSGEGIHVNGVFSGGYTNNHNYTLYVNAYMVLEKGGQYTKHIYIGDQRIVSKLGDVGSFGVDPRREEYAGEDISGTSVPDYKTKYAALQQVIKDNYEGFEVDYYAIDNDDYVNGEGFCCGDNDSPQLKSLPTGNENYEKLQYYYHSDHLGSASYITNLDGEVVQHIEYVPFGEVFIEERNSTWNTPYLFNGKELDEETGLYYYGARYYDPATSRWLSVDPMAEKRPHMSPYNYCSWNPIMKIDPDGMDEWELNKKGEEVNRIKNDKHDSFHIVDTDANGNILKDNDGNSIRTASTKDFDRGTVSAVRKPTINTSNGRRTLTTFEISGDENAKEVFEFLGDNYTRASGKPIEWTHAKIGTEKSGRNIIGTSHDESSTPVGHYLRLTGYTLREVNHNHPSGNFLPSDKRDPITGNAIGKDTGGAVLYKQSNPNVMLNIYTKGGNYSSYDEKGTLGYRTGNMSNFYVTP